MDQETLYTATKWDILRHLEQGACSPLELSQKTGSSLANISSQLRLLEMGGIISSRRITNRDKGQPRVLYEISEDSCYVISTAQSLVDKRRLSMTPAHQVVLKIWFLENPKLRTFCEKGFWKVEEHLGDMDALYVDTTSTRPLCFYVVTHQKLDLPEIHELRDGTDRCPLTVAQVTPSQIEEFRISLLQLYERASAGDNQ